MIILDFLISFLCCSFFPMIFYFSLNDVNIVAIILLLLPSIIDFIADEIVLYKKEKERSALIRTPENERIVLEHLRNNNINLIGYISHEVAVKKMSLEMFEEFLERANNSNNTNSNNETIQDIRTVVDYIKRENAPEFDNYSDDQIVGFIPRSEITQLAKLINDRSIKFGPELERVANYMREINSPNFNNLSDLDIVSSMNYQEIEKILRQININIYIPEDYILTNIKGFNNIEVYSNVNSFLIKPLKQSLTSLCSTNKPIIINRNIIISDLHLHYLLTVIDAAIGE